MGEIVLYPNFGAEEGPNWQSLRGTIGYQTSAMLWRMVFGRNARFADDALESMWMWPEGFGPSPVEPAFAWLRDAAGFVPWLSTPQSVEQAARLGLPLLGPAPEAVGRVHEKAFALRAVRAVGLEPDGIAGLPTVLEPSDLQPVEAALVRIGGVLGRWPKVIKKFTLKPRWGTSGRGRVPGIVGQHDNADIRGAMPRLAAAGGAILEPWLDRVGDLSAQFFVHQSGQIELLGTLRQELSTSGSYAGHSGTIDTDGRISAGTAWDELLITSSTAIVGQAAEQGFWGPCGVDAFVFFTVPEMPNTHVFRPAVELNARFTFGTITIGLVRRYLATTNDRWPSGFCFRVKVPKAAEDSLDGTRMVALPIIAGAEPAVLAFSE